MEHQAAEKPINLVLPVLTRPEIVQQAVAGTLSGQIGLSLLTVEALLVLANAVGGKTHLNTLLHVHMRTGVCPGFRYCHSSWFTKISASVQFCHWKPLVWST